MISNITEEKLLQTAALLAFKSNLEAVAKESMEKAAFTSTDTSFTLAAVRLDFEDS